VGILKTPITTHASSTSTNTPVEYLHIDFAGSFPDGGYILVTDTLTRWVESIYAPNTTALSIVVWYSFLVDLEHHINQDPAIVHIL
jgi:hypothetical protein